MEDRRPTSPWLRTIEETRWTSPRAHGAQHVCLHFKAIKADLGAKRRDTIANISEPTLLSVLGKVNALRSYSCLLDRLGEESTQSSSPWRGQRCIENLHTIPDPLTSFLSHLLQYR